MWKRLICKKDGKTIDIEVYKDYVRNEWVIEFNDIIRTGKTQDIAITNLLNTITKEK